MSFLPSELRIQRQSLDTRFGLLSELSVLLVLAIVAQGYAYQVSLIPSSRLTSETGKAPKERKASDASDRLSRVVLAGAYPRLGVGWHLVTWSRKHCASALSRCRGLKPSFSIADAAPGRVIVRMCSQPRACFKRWDLPT